MLDCTYYCRLKKLIDVIAKTYVDNHKVGYDEVVRDEDYYDTQRDEYLKKYKDLDDAWKVLDIDSPVKEEHDDVEEDEEQPERTNKKRSSNDSDNDDD